jgi:hypothetical protein
MELLLRDSFTGASSPVAQLGFSSSHSSLMHPPCPSFFSSTSLSSSCVCHLCSSSPRACCCWLELLRMRDPTVRSVIHGLRRRQCRRKFSTLRLHCRTRSRICPDWPHSRLSTCSPSDTYRKIRGCCDRRGGCSQWLLFHFAVLQGYLVVDNSTMKSIFYCQQLHPQYALS